MPSERITLHLDRPIGTISPLLHGQFAEHLGACVDGGLWVGCDGAIEQIGGFRRDVVEALRRIGVPILRWPGGCFADDYHWSDGIGPPGDRPRTVNLWWGQTLETNAVGTHEFMRLCQLLGAQPYLAGNVGSGTVRELRDWVEYCNFPGDSSLARRRAGNGSPFPFNVRHWGVGNENWGCGGHFTPEAYAADYRRYATYLKDFGEAPLYLIACGPDCGGRPDFHLDWTRRFLQSLDGFERIHGLAAHYYCGTAGSATSFTTDQWYELLEKAALVEPILLAQRRVMDEFDPQRRIGLVLDEWGTWHPPTPGKNPQHLWQQNTLRDALVAGITLDAFHRQCGILAMANLAQMVNVLQALILTEGDHMVRTPTYHVFDLYQAHRGRTALAVDVESFPVHFAVGEQRRRMPALSGSASRGSDGIVCLSLVNVSADTPVEAAIEFPGATILEATGLSLTHEDLAAHNTFDSPDELAPRPVTVRLDTPIRHHLEPASVTLLRLKIA